MFISCMCSLWFVYSGLNLKIVNDLIFDFVFIWRIFKIRFGHLSLKIWIWFDKWLLRYFTLKDWRVCTIWFGHLSLSSKFEYDPIIGCWDIPILTCWGHQKQISQTNTVGHVTIQKVMPPCTHLASQGFSARLKFQDRLSVAINP